MTNDSAKHYLLKKLFLLFPLFLIIGLFLFPYLLKTCQQPAPLVFHISSQEESRHTITMIGKFNQDVPAHERIWLYAENAQITLQYGAAFFRCNTGENTPSFFHSPGSGWYCFDSPGISAGSKVKFTVQSYYGNHQQAARQLADRIYMGDGSGLYQLMLGQIGFFDLLHLCALIAGLLYIEEGAIDAAAGVHADGIRIAMFGFYCFSGGIWCVTDVFYPYFSLLISPQWAAALLDISGILLFPIAIAALMRHYTRDGYRHRVMTCILAAEIMVGTISILLQLTGIIDLVELQYIINFISFILLGTALLCIGLEFAHYRDNYLLLLFLTVLPVFVSEILDGLNVLWSFMPQRFIMRYSFGISILLLILQLASYASAELKKVKRLQQMEDELTDSKISIMLSQIHPHFLYNSLVGIKQLCDSNPQKASDALEHFAYYLRENLHSVTQTKLIPFEKEIAHVTDYLYLEKMRFEERIQIHWELEYTDFFLPPLTLQPIVENAVRHGITKKEHGGTITIKSEVLPDEIHIKVTDDGVGFDPDANSDTSRPHIGIENVRRRLENQCGGRIYIDSSYGSLTEVLIILPRKEEL